MNPEFRIQGISHMTFICKDLAKTAKMLKEVFSAEEIYSSDTKQFSLSKEKFFKVANLWIAIMEGDAIERTYNHIAFKVDDKDLAFLTEKIKSLGLTVLPGRKREKSEGDSLYFYDYDNHLFEFHAGDLDTRLALYKEAEKNT